ncbi:MAG: hypothetical protein O7G85_02000 [Planctomycetota bacterium]|nr:hypothetical protein [Planctomycetota bacterium]
MGRIRIILIVLLVGALFNISVAWGIQIWGVQSLPPMFNPIKSPKHLYDNSKLMPLSPYEIAAWSRVARHDWPDKPARIEVQNSAGSCITHMVSYGYDRRIPESDIGSYTVISIETFNAHIIERGWPFQSLAMDYRTETGPLPFYEDCSGLSVADRYLPIRVLWSGFIINTLLYSTVLLILVKTPGVMKRQLRQKRGLCITCKYDLSGAKHEACPECGHSIRLNRLIK